MLLSTRGEEENNNPRLYRTLHGFSCLLAHFVQISMPEGEEGGLVLAVDAIHTREREKEMPKKQEQEINATKLPASYLKTEHRNQFP